MIAVDEATDDALEAKFRFVLLTMQTSVYVSRKSDVAQIRGLAV